MPQPFENMPNDPFSEIFGRLFGSPQQSKSVPLASILNQDAIGVVRSAAAKAASRNSLTIELGHLTRALIDEPAVAQILSTLKVDIESLSNKLDKASPTFPQDDSTEGGPRIGQTVQRIIFSANQMAQMSGSSSVNPEQLFFAVLGSQSEESRILTESGVTAQALQAHATVDASGKTKFAKTPALDQFGIDLTELAREGKIDPMIGRQDEVSQTIEVLLRRTKNNPVLIGEPGVGKTAIVEGIAQAIVNNSVPPLLRGKRVVSLNLTSMVAGTKFRGDFEERITKVINEIVANKNEIIVFIDELHTILGAGGNGEGGMDAGNILKPKLARGELHLIGATTLKEYRKIEKDGALERRFQPVKVAEPSTSDAVLILKGIKSNFEQHHQVEYTDDAILAAVELSNRYVTDRFLPDKAIDLIDQAGARKRLQASTSGNVKRLEDRLLTLEDKKADAISSEQFENAAALKKEIDQVHSLLAQYQESTNVEVLPVDESDIADVISRLTGIPVSRLRGAERSKLANLAVELHERVVGQEEAVQAVSKAIRRSRSGMGDPNRPVGSFLFLGPTGVGKTELVKTLTHSLFGTEKSMIRFDMSEYGEKHTVSRLIGAPPGYVGHDEAGQLTEKVRRNPYSVVLLDEIEKAHPDIFNLLLQVLDDGRLTDGQGRTVDFRNTVIIMTSNLGSEFLASKSGAVGFISSGDSKHSETEIRNRVMGKLRETMRPEFINRIDEVVLFHKLERVQLEAIVRLMLLDTEARLAAQGITLEVSKETVSWLADKGYEPEYGARPLRRLIQRKVEDSIADLLVDEVLHPGGAVQIRVNNDELEVEARHNQGVTLTFDEPVEI